MKQVDDKTEYELENEPAERGSNADQSSTWSREVAGWPESFETAVARHVFEFPALPEWNEWLAWRAQEVLNINETKGRGEGPGLTAADESQLWRQKKETYYVKVKNWRDKISERKRERHTIAKVPISWGS